MLRRLASLGHTSSDDQLPSPMSPSPGDEQDARASGGLAGVFKGLAGGGKLTKSPPPSHQSLVSLAASQSFADRSGSSVALPTGLRGLAPDQAELYGRLKDKNVLLSERVAAASSLRYAIADFPLNPILDIWEAGKDLIEPEKPTGARHAGWELLTECVKCPTSTELERREYYDTLTSQAHPEDFHLQLAALEDLTSQGRNVSGFSYDIFPLLVNWLQSTHKAVKAARRSAQRGPGRLPKGLALGEEKNLSQLFTFITHVIKFNSKFARETAVGYLLDVVEVICMSTSYEQDLRMCIDMLKTIVTFGSIPMDKLQPCIYVLSSIHCVVPQLKKEAWKTIANICKSHHGQSTIRILLGVLRNYSPAQNEDKNLEKENERELVRKVRGVLSVLKKLLFKSPDKGFPLISLALLMDGLEHVATAKSTRIATEVLSLINTLLDDPDTNDISAIVAEEHWGMMFAIAAKCAVKAHSTNAADPDAGLRLPLNKDESESEYTVKAQLIRLLNRIERLLVQKGADFLQRDECLAFLTEVHQALPDSTAGLVINHFKDSRSCLPSDADWKKNLNIALDGFYLNRNRDPLTRLHALEVAIEVYNFLNLAEDLVDENEVVSLIRRLLAGISEETNTLVLQDTVTFLVQVAETATPSLFAEIMDDLKKVVAKDMAKAPLAMLNAPKAASYVPGQTIYVANQSLSNVVTRGYIQIFIRTLNYDGSKASKAFMALVHIARSNSCEVDARLTAMKMIFRLRADSEYQIYLSTLTENESLAGTLYRTEASLARKLAEDAAQPSRLSRAEQGGIASRPSRGVSFSQGQTGDRVPPARQAHTPKPTIPKGQRLWSVPDADALPETPPKRPSWVLVSYKDYEDGGAELREPVKMVLNVSAWLEALLSLFHNGCDWEVYSFVLAHLPSQLSNHPFFRGAVTYIHELRRFFCEMIKTNSFQEPPSSSGLRRTDVGNCLFHSLIMILSYHEHFQKVDEDDLVRTFIHGITDKTAKTCIHALQICCHELPLSLSKSLVTILQKMSQVITQPLVAMHILEFLACLSRMQSLYTNFREDEYRLIFGICARYLQSVRDKKQNAARSTPHTGEPSTPSTTAANQPELGLQPVTDDLPQYVHALAYHVIVFWFLAVKLHDRPSHIPWIAKNLFVDSDGKATNEEQALVTLDFMQRVAFSDACDSAQDTNFNEQQYGEIQKKRWIIGNSIVTIRQAKETGWAEITRRYPSGTSAFAIRVEFTPMPNQTATDSLAAASREGRFQHGITIFPSHLLMQLLAPMPQMSDPAMRPIPLPDDDGVSRAIRTFDRNSTVDSHKVGVIYIADGQTNELEILTNTIGGPDYLEFLNGLGSLTRLKGASFNTQGLDTHDDMDGQYTYCWRDRVTEIVFHVTTQMPNHPHDAQCIFKKRHIGNDFVNIIWNDSGLPFRFDQFPSQFNYVYIIITPTPRRSFAATRELASKREGDTKCHSPFYMVQVMSAPGFPEISPAAEPKLVSLGGLPSLVRLVALNASVFSLVWSSRDGEHVSSWRNRLQEINRLRERYGPKGSHPSGGLAPSPPPNALAAAAAAAGGIPTLQVMQTAQGGSGAGGGMTMDSMMAGGGGMSRPPSGMRDSFSSLRRSSVATFFTSGGSTNNDPMSHRSSLLSTTTADNAEIAQVNATEALVDSVDFSKWT